MAGVKTPSRGGKTVSPYVFGLQETRCIHVGMCIRMVTEFLDGILSAHVYVEYHTPAVDRKKVCGDTFLYEREWGQGGRQRIWGAYGSDGQVDDVLKHNPRHYESRGASK